MEHQGYVIKRDIGQYPLYKGEAPRLNHLDIELTERCNNACMHCYINLPANDEQAIRKELTTERWKDILKQAAELGTLSVRFTGGEPLLRPDFAELYLFTRRLGLKVILFTNARLITPELAELFARVPLLKKIEISVYGMHPESYEAVACTLGSFADYQRGVNLLLERQVPFIVKSVLLPPNRTEIAEFEAWSATIPGMDIDPKYAVFLDLRARKDSPSRNRLISSLRIWPDDGMGLLARDEDNYRKAMAQFCARFIGLPGDLLFTCGAGKTGCVDAYGNYQMCMLLRHPDTVYDLSKGSLREALTEVFPSLRKLRAENPDYLKRCARCFLKGLCEQCPGKSWSEHGTLDTPVEYHCQLAHVQARYLGLLSEDEQSWQVTNWQERIADLVQKSAAEKNLPKEYSAASTGDAQ